MNNNSAPHRMEPQGPLTPPELLLGKCTGIHWKVWIPALLTTYCILLKDLHKQKSLPENKQILYQQSFPKPATVWLDTKIPLFWVLLHCWERTKPNAVKTPWKAESHFFAALYHTSVFRHQPFFLIYQHLSGVSATQQLLAPGHFFSSLPDHSQQHPQTVTLLYSLGPVMKPAHCCSEK